MFVCPGYPYRSENKKNCIKQAPTDSSTGVFQNPHEFCVRNNNPVNGLIMCTNYKDH